jgi:hypothetical protein
MRRCLVSSPRLFLWPPLSVITARSLLQRNQPMLNLEPATVRLPAAEVEPSQPTIPGNNLKSYSPLGLSEFNHPAHGKWHLQQRNSATQNLVSACSRNLRLLRLPSSSARTHTTIKSRATNRIRNRNSSNMHLRRSTHRLTHHADGVNERDDRADREFWAADLATVSFHL